MPHPQAPPFDPTTARVLGELGRSPVVVYGASPRWLRRGWALVLRTLDRDREVTLAVQYARALGDRLRWRPRRPFEAGEQLAFLIH